MKATHSIIEKRYPMHACGPARKVGNATEGISRTPLGTVDLVSPSSHRSGRKTAASGPRTSVSRLDERMGIDMNVFCATLCVTSKQRERLDIQPSEFVKIVRAASQYRIMRDSFDVYERP